MDSYCSRCDASFTVTDELHDSGICPTCGAQLIFGRTEASDVASGAIAMVFLADSNISEPLETAFSENTIDLQASLAVPASPVAAGDAAGRSSAGDTPGSDSGAPSFFGSVEAAPGSNAKATASDGGGESTLPAHLQLPNIDFSMPSFEPGAGGADYESAGTSGEGADLSPDLGALSETGGGELPAHLQLPSFPDFGLNPPESPGSTASAQAPGESPSEASDAEPGGADDIDIDTGEDPLGGPGDPFPTGVISNPAAAAPPPMPPGLPPRTERRNTNPQAVPVSDLAAAPEAPMSAPMNGGHAGLPGLPTLGLPQFNAPAESRDVTLLDRDEAEELVAEVRKSTSSSWLAKALIASAGVMLIGVIGGGIYLWQRGVDTVVEEFHQPEVPKVVETPADKARALLAEGIRSFQAKKTEAAVSSFEQAVASLPKFAEAHYWLGVSYAKLKKQHKAAKHYKRFLHLKPTGPEAAEVQKIVEDYDKAQAKQASSTKQNRRRRRKQR